jgi:hypothetical protein
MPKCKKCGAEITGATATPCGHPIPFQVTGAVKLAKRKPKAKARKKR